MTAANISRPFGAGSQQPHSAQAAAVGDVSAEALRQLISTRDEIAVVDARETFVHARDGHILLSVSLPLSQLELKSAALLPRRTVRIVVYDSGTGNLAARAAQRLVELGYRNVSVLNGGTAAWKAAGYSLFTGVNVVGKAFGEFVEHVQGTPHLSVQDVKARLDAGDNVVVIDSRTEPEFRNFSIPGAINTPGAEIVYRFYQAVPDPETLVVVNCAGRTRSIIGAQALINAGVPNKVVALENGTMDWLIAGFTLDSQKSNLPGEAERRCAGARQGVRGEAHRGICHPLDRPNDAGGIPFRQRQGTALAICARCAQPRRIRGRACSRIELGAGRPARPAKRRVGRHAQRPHRAGR